MVDADPQNHDDNDIDVEKPCEICGDIGFINAIRDCSLCRITREHAYCMKVMLEAEADAWICEECESAKVTLSSPEEPHLEKNVSTAEPCTFGDPVKDNSVKYALIVVQERNLLLTPNSLPRKEKKKRIKGQPKPEDGFLVIGLPIKHVGAGLFDYTLSGQLNCVYRDATTY